jgi:ankyrin repeat protein
VKFFRHTYQYNLALVCGLKRCHQLKMTETAKKQFLEKVSKTKHKHCGTLDENGFRIEAGCEHWYYTEFAQKYSGQFFFNNLHNKGVYLINKKGDQTYFDGLFYSNKLEGYGKVIYANSTAFEGLFKQHARFGPGVLTYSDDTQDVGLWDGLSLRRLSVFVGESFVPRLGRTSLGKARLLKFRNLVPICTKTRDPAKEILTELGADEEILAQADHLYNLQVRNPDSVFFNKKIYDHSFFPNESCTIEVLLSREEYEEENVECEQVQEEELEQRPGLDGEMFGSFSKNSSKCSCFRVYFDKFGHICVQLQEVEMKLEKLKVKKERIEKSLRKCKYCCDNIILKQPEKEESKDVEDEQELVVKTPSDEIPSDIKIASSNRRDSKKVLSFYSSSGETEESAFNQQDVTRSEIELQNYLYTYNSTLFNEEGILRPSSDIQPQDRYSKATLPFSEFSSLISNAHNSRIKFSNTIDYDLYNVGGAAEENLTAQHIRTLEACICDDLLIENVDVLRENLNSLSQEESFYTCVKNNLKKHLDVEFQKFSQAAEEETRFVKKVVVTDLLAWNNETIWIMMLQHCFRHRLSENNVTFSVSDLLTGHRHYFKNAGVYETSCKKFLEECCEGHEKEVFDYIRTGNINPDLCDGRGNTGLMLASIRDKISVIAMLTNCGAKVDVMNDEGLTPLTISLLKYISFKLRVSDWEKAFLREVKLAGEDLINIQQWRPTESIVSVYRNLQADASGTEVKDQFIPDLPLSDAEPRRNSSAERSGSNLLAKQKVSEFDSKAMIGQADSHHHEQKYVFSTEFVRIRREESKSKKQKKKGKKKKKGKHHKKSKSKTTIKTKSRSRTKHKERKHKKKKKEKGKHKKKEKEKRSKTSLHEHKSEANEEKFNKKLETIKKTILTLLNYGSDPNIGEVPLKPLFLSVFTDDSELLSGLLKNKADPNATISDENMTSLHLIVSLKLSPEKVKMSEILLSHKADSNIRTNSNHWWELKREIIGEDCKEIDVEDKGKNVLHMLCLREDFIDDTDNLFGAVANILVLNGCKTDDLYLGHSPLSLAVIRGNSRLIEALLETKKVDPYQLLDNGMGNAFTVVILNRFSSLLSHDTKIEAARALLENGVNPLVKVGEFENVIAFMEHEEHLAKLKKMSSKKMLKKKKKKKGKSRGSSKTSSKKSSAKSSKRSSNKRSKKSRKRSSKRSSKKRKRDHSKTKLEPIEHYITGSTRKILYRHLQGRAVQYLYSLITETLIADPLIVVLAKFVTPDEALNCIQLLFQSGVVDSDAFSYVVICDLLEFVRLQNNVDRDKNVQERERVEKVIKEMSWKEVKRDPHEICLSLPEADRDVDKYRVCYQCLKQQGKKLIRCPSCELVYFCSQECNALNNKHDSRHHCKMLFYDTVNEIINGQPQPSRLQVLLEMADKMKKERLAMFELKVLNEKMSKIKYISNRMKKRGDELLHNFKKLEREKEAFGKANTLWDFSQIYTQSKDLMNKLRKAGSSQKDLGSQVTFSTTQVKRKSPETMASELFTAYSAILQTTTSTASDVLQSLPVSAVGPGLRSYDPIPDLSPTQAVSSSTKTSLKRGTPRTTRASSTVSFELKPRRPSNFVETTSVPDTRRFDGKTFKSENFPSRLTKSDQPLETGKVHKNRTGGFAKKMSREHQLHEAIKSYNDKHGLKMFKDEDLSKLVNLYGMGNEKNRVESSDDEQRPEIVKKQQGMEKTKKVGDKNYYMDLLSKIFADFNLPLLLLPYACYKDGQVYYSMSGNMSYFGSSFHKLKIPD